ncbi:MAG: hypothetical protein ACRD43_02385 [Pyrinomonadaceae bacterium]
MDIGTEIRKSLNNEWLPTIYVEEVRSQRTRAYALDIVERENRAEILYTLLGIELKVGNKRFGCPDLATARYLRIFARMGCRKFAVPYDITKISGIADEMETAWQRLLLLIDSKTKESPPRLRTRLRSALVREIRTGITESGSGEMMPEFKAPRKQK